MRFRERVCAVSRPCAGRRPSDAVPCILPQLIVHPHDSGRECTGPCVVDVRDQCAVDAYHAQASPALSLPYVHNAPVCVTPPIEKITTLVCARTDKMAHKISARKTNLKATRESETLVRSDCGSSGARTLFFLLLVSCNIIPRCLSLRIHHERTNDPGAHAPWTSCQRAGRSPHR